MPADEGEAGLPRRVSMNDFEELHPGQRCLLDLHARPPAGVWWRGLNIIMIRRVLDPSMCAPVGPMLPAGLPNCWQHKPQLDDHNSHVSSISGYIVQDIA